MDIRDALDRLRPGAAWRNQPITGDLAADYDKIIWEDQTIKPTLAEIQQALSALAGEQAAGQAAKHAEEQATLARRQNIQFALTLLDADESQIRTWIRNNGAETTAVRLTEILQFILRWIRRSELRNPDLSD